MMRTFLKYSPIALCVAAFGLAGCESGSVQEGLPPESERTVSADMQKQMQINMAPSKASDIAKKTKAAEKATSEAGAAK
jgi:hypothetical protein